MEDFNFKLEAGLGVSYENRSMYENRSRYENWSGYPSWADYTILNKQVEPVIFILEF